MTIQKIIFLTSQPFIIKNYEIYGLSILNNNGFFVEIWNFIPFLNPHLSEEIDDIEKKLVFKLEHFKTKKEALYSLSKIDKNKTIVISFLGNNHTYENFAFYRSLSINNITYGWLILYAIPLLDNEKLPLLSRLKKAKKVKNIITFCLSKLPIKYLGIKPCSYIMTSGKKSLHTKHPFVGVNTDLIMGHAMDYERYLQVEEQGVSASMFNEKYMVFLDQFLPFHPDFFNNEKPLRCRSETYYKELNDFFSFIEKKYNLKIIIAAHPKVNKLNYSFYFNHRTTIKNRTIELIKNATIVLTHCSTAINFAVLYKKPIVFCSSKKYSIKYQKYIQLFATHLQTTVVDIPILDSFDLKKHLFINQKAYENYRSNYVKQANSSNTSIWNILTEYIKNKNEQKVIEKN